MTRRGQAPPSEQLEITTMHSIMAQTLYENGQPCIQSFSFKSTLRTCESATAPSWHIVSGRPSDRNEGIKSGCTHRQLAFISRSIHPGPENASSTTTCQCRKVGDITTAHQTIGLRQKHTRER